MNYKVCTKCNTNLPATTKFFHVQKRGLYNLKSHCKECNTKYNKTIIVLPLACRLYCNIAILEYVLEYSSTRVPYELASLGLGA